MSADGWMFGFLGLGLTGLVGLIVAFGFVTQNKDNGAEIKKNLGIIFAVSLVIVFLFGVISYMYFTTNVNYLTPFLLVMTFVNMFLSLFAVSAASLNVSSS